MKTPPYNWVQIRSFTGEVVEVECTSSGAAYARERAVLESLHHAESWLVERSMYGMVIRITHYVAGEVKPC